MSENEKTREARLRREAKRLEVILLKSRARQWSVDNQQGFRITDLHTSGILAGSRFELNLDDVEDFLRKSEGE